MIHLIRGHGVPFITIDMPAMRMIMFYPPIAMYLPSLM